MVVAGTYLTEQAEPLDESLVREGLAGNLCRCTGYNKIVDSVMACRQNSDPVPESGNVK
jgi:carbon-monoxide dehydrogenase small subunit